MQLHNNLYISLHGTYLFYPKYLVYPAISLRYGTSESR